MRQGVHGPEHRGRQSLSLPGFAHATPGTAFRSSLSSIVASGGSCIIGRIEALRRSLVVRLVSVAAIALCSAPFSACRLQQPSGDTLAGWGLPRDLAARLDHVEVLRLPPSVPRLDWLPDHLEVLDVQAASIETVAGLPAGLRRLDLSYASVSCLDELPASIEAVDLRWTEVEGHCDFRWEARDSLRVLLTGGRGEPTLRFPVDLYAFGSFDAPFEEGAALPEDLGELYLQGPGVVALRDLPTGLTVLSLQATRVRDLEGVPDSVTTLALHETELVVEEWPPFLTSLSVTVPSVRYSSDLPESLRMLHVSGAGRAVRAKDFWRLGEGLVALSVLSADSEFLAGVELPPNLESLDLTGFQGTRLGPMPGSLSEVVLAYSAVEDLEPLPEALRHLDVSGLDPALLSTLGDPGWPLEELESLVFQRFPSSELVPLPATLRKLDVSGSRKMVHLGEIPEGLERLDVSSTGLVQLPELPASLRSLSITGTAIETVDGLLPDGLRELVLAPGQVRSLGRLPESLRILRFESAPPRGAAPAEGAG